MLSVLGVPCALLAAWGVRTFALARGEWSIIGYFVGAVAVLVGAPGTALAIGRLRVGIALMRGRPDAVARAKKLADWTLLAHVFFWTMSAWFASYLTRGDLTVELFAFVFAALVLSAVLVGHALAARALARDEATSSARPL